MEGRHSIIILPISILLFAILATYALAYSQWPLSINIYIVIVFLVSLYTAKQSIFIQTSLLWNLDDLQNEEKNSLGVSITKDFLIFLVIHLLIVSIAYLVLYWVIQLL